jgi:cellulose synthase/poly-beta-1,6-N-acetylglucosamine synthase-like glycosyltransferase
MGLTILAGIAILQGILTLVDGIRAARHIRTFRPRRLSSERVMVFCPCKGTDSEFEKNIQSILGQDYSNFEVQFIVESEDDPACATLRHLKQNVLIAGKATDQGQKVHNLSCAVRHVGSSADVYVFCDSDARFPKDWLSKLLAPLNSGKIATGYRWYVPQRFHFPTLMRSAWNASSVGILGNHDRNDSISSNPGRVLSVTITRSHVPPSAPAQKSFLFQSASSLRTVNVASRNSSNSPRDKS